MFSHNLCNSSGSTPILEAVTQPKLRFVKEVIECFLKIICGISRMRDFKLKSKYN